VVETSFPVLWFVYVIHLLVIDLLLPVSNVHSDKRVLMTKFVFQVS